MEAEAAMPLVVAARGWLGTRFQHQGRCKRSAMHRGGVDCLGLLMGIAKELMLKARDGRALTTHDRLDYGHYPAAGGLQCQLDALLWPGEPPMMPGQIGLFRIDGQAQHLGIFTDYAEAGDGLGLIHAYAPARQVVEHRLDVMWERRLAGLWRVEF